LLTFPVNVMQSRFKLQRTGLPIPDGKFKLASKKKVVKGAVSRYKFQTSVANFQQLNLIVLKLSNHVNLDATIKHINGRGRAVLSPRLTRLQIYFVTLFGVCENC
jgi:hypothetical protein